jgi:hypothetical protein
MPYWNPTMPLAKKSRTQKEARNQKKKETNIETAKKTFIKTNGMGKYENRVNTYPSFGLPNGFRSVLAGELLSTSAFGVHHFLPIG